MIVTEKEAKKKWCPFTRLIPDDDAARVAWNRVSHAESVVLPTDSMCIGSKCMAWRWTIDRVLVDLKNGETRPCVDVEFYDARQWCRQDRQSATSGYCGLAGKVTP